MSISLNQSNLKLEVGGTPNAVQSLLNLVQGSNVTIADNGNGSVTIAAAGSSGSPIGGVSSKTANYLVVAGDEGKIISVTSSSTVQITLPATPPSATFKVFIQNLGTGLVQILPNSLTIDGTANINLHAGSGEGVYVSTDGTNYFTTRGRISIATATTLGTVIPDGTIITVSGTGAITVPKASNSVFGVVEVDGTTITSAAGVISAVASSGGPTTQTVFNSSTRQVNGTVYQNTTGKPLWVTVSTLVPNTQSVSLISDSSATPTTVIGFALNSAGGASIAFAISGVILPNNYYLYKTSSGVVTFESWVEWS